MAEVPLNVVITANSAAIKKALRGIQKEVLGTETKSRKEIEKTDRARKRSLQRTRSQVTALGTQFNKLGKGIQRELSNSIFTGVKRGRQRAAAWLKQNKGAIVAGLAVGAGAGVRSAYRRGSGFLGLPTQQGAFQEATQYRIKYRQFANAAGMMPLERDAFMKRIRGKSEETGATEGDILSGAARVQAAMGSEGLQAYETQLDNLININQSLGAPMDDLAGVLVELNRQFGLSAEQFPEAIGFMVEAANEGSIEVTDFAGNMRSSMGVWAASFGEGMDSWKQLVSTAETVGTTYDPAVVATAMERGAETLGLARNTPSEVRKWKRMGLDVNLPPVQLGQQMREKGITAPQLKELVPDLRSRRMLMTLMAQGGGQYLGLQGQVGLDRAKRQAADFRTSPEGEIVAARSTILRNVNEQFKEVGEAAMDVAGKFEILASKNVLLAQKLGVAIDIITPMLMAAGGYTILKGSKNIKDAAGLMKGGGAAGGTAGGTAAATGAGLVSTLGLGGLVAGGAMGTGMLLGREFPEFGAQVNKKFGGVPILYDPSRQERIFKSQEEAARYLEKSARNLNAAASSHASSGKQEGGP